MLYDITGAYEKVGQGGRNDDDVYDRYSHRWTIIILAIFIVAVSAKQFVGEPIECIPPSDFGSEHKTYVENYCWIHSTYSIDDKTALTRNFVRGGKDSRTTPYYIWIPYILIAAALLTYLPAWLWHTFGHRATFDIPAMIVQLSKTKLTDPDERKTTLVILAKHYEKSRLYSKPDSLWKKLSFFAGGGTLTGIYLLVKIFYLLNAIGQFVLLNYYLQIDYLSYGQKIIYGIISGRSWSENTIIFPRVVFCDFTIRYLGDNTPKYTVQCTLPINLYNERIFAFYWCWLVFLFCITIYGIIVWLGRMSYRGRRSFLKKHLRLGLELEFTDQNAELFDKFADKYLGGDGILFLRLTAKNTNPVIAGELLVIMWKQFVEAETKLEVVSSKTDDVDTFLNARGISSVKQD